MDELKGLHRAQIVNFDGHQHMQCVCGWKGTIEIPVDADRAARRPAYRESDEHVNPANGYVRGADGRGWVLAD